MKGFKALQIEDIRNISDGLQHATLLNITGASGSSQGGSPCNTISHGTLRNSPDWTHMGTHTSLNSLYATRSFINTVTGEVAVAHLNRSANPDLTWSDIPFHISMFHTPPPYR